MAKIQCKMCGGQVELPDGVTSGECPYCGTLTTFPKIVDSQTEQLYARAEHLRQTSNFDKAVAAYESILERNSEDPEAYWGLLISKYGIEYVEDPATHERIPTCHRVQFDSILVDDDYRNALKYASDANRSIYENEAHRIAEIQKDILRISAQEKPYDVFICYKESTDGGTRTKDSVLAQDIYFQLTRQGLKVFFARITLEKKLGRQYEPYIFAALNSAKVMLVIGSKKEYFEAVWVKNEWSRYLALVKKDPSRLLIPCYRDMDAYDIPEELSMFQCQDMSKIGFIQDILYGITKVVNANKQPEPPPSPIIAQAVPPAPVPGAYNNKFGAGYPQTPGYPPAPGYPPQTPGYPPQAPVYQPPVEDKEEKEKILKRIKVLLEQKDWRKAKSYCEKMLETDPENSELYLLLTMAKAKSINETMLWKRVILANDRNFRTALRFASPAQKEHLLDLKKKNVQFLCISVFLLAAPFALPILVYKMTHTDDVLVLMPVLFLISMIVMFFRVRNR